MQYTTVGHDSEGREYIAVGQDVYRVESYSTRGNPVGRWVSKLAPFRESKLYRTVDERSK